MQLRSGDLRFTCVTVLVKSKWKSFISLLCSSKKRLQTDFSGFATDIVLVTKKLRFRNFAPLTCYAPLPPFSSRFNSSSMVAKPPLQAHFKIIEPSFAENQFLSNLFHHLSPVVQLAPKPAAVFDRSVDRLRIPASLDKTSTFIQLSLKLNMLRFCSQGGAVSSVSHGVSLFPAPVFCWWGENARMPRIIDRALPTRGRLF